MKHRDWGILFVCVPLLFLPALPSSARPRPPLPPLPELAPLLARATFDEPFWARSENPAAFHPAYTDLVESWSGCALRRSGVSVTPFIVPAADVAGRTNVNATAGAVRFWFRPQWSSATGSGVDGRLMELSVADAKGSVAVWSLVASPEGGALFLAGATYAGAELLLAVPIDWEAGQWHLVALNYGPKGTALFLDGLLAGEGDGTLAVPPHRAALTVGSTRTGGAPAGGEFDEVCAFARPLFPLHSLLYYGAFSRYAELGPVTAEEEAVQREQARKRKAQREAEGGGPQRLMMQGLTNCPANAVVWITNVTSVITTNEGIVTTFDVVGGTNGYLYDIFATTNLCCTNIANTAWAWLERGPTCSTYQYTNQPAVFSFYVLRTPQDSDGEGLTDAFERLVTKTNPHNADTDGDGIDDYDEWRYGLNPALDDSQQPGRSQEFRYDARSRLTDCFLPSRYQVIYDAEGNITTIISWN